MRGDIVRQRHGAQPLNANREGLRRCTPLSAAHRLRWSCLQGQRQQHARHANHAAKLSVAGRVVMSAELNCKTEAPMPALAHAAARTAPGVAATVCTPSSSATLMYGLPSLRSRHTENCSSQSTTVVVE